MTITLTVEDGSVVSGANTYCDVLVGRAYASDRGVDLGGTDDTVASLLIQSMDYFRQFDDKWKGFLVNPDQSLAFPRQGVIIHDTGYAGFDSNLVNGNENILPFGRGTFFPSNMIPPNLVYAQVQLAMAIKSGVVILPNVAAGTLPITKDKIGPIETDYADPASMVGYNWYAVRLPAVTALLKPLLANGGRLRSVRI